MVMGWLILGFGVGMACGVVLGIGAAGRHWRVL